MEEKDIYKKAKKRVKQKKGFFTHFGTYIAVGIFFLLMNIFTWEGEIWFVFPMLPWGAGLLIHYFSVFGLPGSKVLSREWEEKELDKEIEHLQRVNRKLGIKNRLTAGRHRHEDGLDLRELDKQKEELFDEEDLV
jgi:hypothetical protein